ncbi:molecular chaperone DnaJ [Synechococcus sp. EJ6-Ellesmere]|uniref:molecular chaperone DnaJ n=1 Tax=Synechococcus sp. EJ6-Ellesmere TaxID=2823734 RepID=UPI0020CD4FAD|nr:molecular chaperone DnaJ [Synechococcus sp. EJ6-Ellesmere]MCP9825528.1 molecular chaperone DnaJ [Synechococcus sp. EJ6-Ellesmere]
MTKMPQTLRQPVSPLARTRPAEREPSKGFGTNKATRTSGGRAKTQAKGGRKRNPALSKADWGPLGKHPDLDAIVARQRLHLPRCGRITAPDVTRAWKLAAAEHHPDRGGQHDTMQLVNGARDLLLGRGVKG